MDAEARKYGDSPFKLMTSLMMKAGGRSCYVTCQKVFDVTASSRLELPAVCGEGGAGRRKFVCVLLLFPAEGAKQAINRSNLI